MLRPKIFQSKNDPTYHDINVIISLGINVRLQDFRHKTLLTYSISLNEIQIFCNSDL